MAIGKLVAMLLATIPMVINLHRRVVFLSLLNFPPALTMRLGEDLFDGGPLRIGGSRCPPPILVHFHPLAKYNNYMNKIPVAVPHDKLTAFCRSHHIRKLSFFGSVLRSDFSPESDIDVLVEFEAEHSPGYLGMVRLQRELSDIFEGRIVDLRTPRELSKYFRQEVLAGAAVQYAA